MIEFLAGMVCGALVGGVVVGFAFFYHIAFGFWHILWGGGTASKPDEHCPSCQQDFFYKGVVCDCCGMCKYCCKNSPDFRELPEGWGDR